MQCLAPDQSHIDIENAVDFAPVMDRDDMRLLQDCGGAGLAQKSSTEGLIIGVSSGEYLQGDGSALICVVSLVHLTHAALAKQLPDFIFAELAADERHDTLLRSIAAASI